MIEIKYSGICVHCDHEDLHLDETVYHYEGGQIKEYAIHCKHEAVCAAWNSGKKEKIAE